MTANFDLARTAVAAILSADAQFTTPLTGGVYTTEEISRQATPSAFDANSELQPCALIKVENTTDLPVIPIAGLQFIVVWCYQRDNSNVISDCLARAHQLLNRQRISGTWDIRFTDYVASFPDPALAAQAGYMRFAATVNLRHD